MSERFSRLPLYCQLANTIEDKITSGVWKTGDRIPSEQELGEQYGMSRITVRKAVEELERQGRVEKIQGKGTFVIGRSIVQNLGNLYSFTHEMERQGKVSSTRLLERRIEKASHRLSLNLGVEKGEDVIYVERLRCADHNQPIMLERAYFSAASYPFIMDIDLDTQPLYQTLEDSYGVHIDKAIERFKACELTPEECDKLECQPKQYGLLVKRTAYSKDSVVCFSSTVSSGDMFEFTLKLEE